MQKSSLLGSRGEGGSSFGSVMDIQMLLKFVLVKEKYAKGDICCSITEGDCNI
jgi:nitrite reductase (NADH) large subunit